MNDNPIKTDDATGTMSDPIAFFITWPTYGTWLPGDDRGWVEYKGGWQLPKPQLELECGCRMTEQACLLSEAERAIVQTQVAETCQYRGWQLHAVSCRFNHAHIVVAAFEINPRKSC